jgi:hypothetical protein
MKIFLNTVGGKEGFVNIIVTAYVAPCNLVSLCERFEKPAASLFKAEDLKSENIFFQKFGPLSRIRHYSTSQTSASLFIVASNSRRIWIQFETAFHRFASGAQRKNQQRLNTQSLDMHSKGVSVSSAIAYIFVLVIMAANPLDRTILFPYNLPFWETLPVRVS